MNGARDPYDASADLPKRLVSSAAYPDVEWTISVDHDIDTGAGRCVLSDLGDGIAATSASVSTCNTDWELPSTTTPYEGGSPDPAHGGTIILQVIIPEN